MFIHFAHFHVQVKKDTERIDEIRAIKRAWEEAEPGRAARAAASRQKFLDENMIRVKDEEEEEEVEVCVTAFFLVAWLVHFWAVAKKGQCM